MRLPILPLLLCILGCGFVHAQTLEQQLQRSSAAQLAAAARINGDAQRGAILFHQVHVGCVKCHSVDGLSNSLGPDLTRLGQQQNATDEHIISSLLKPSAEIRRGYESVTVVTTDGRTHTGLLVERTDDMVTLRDPARNGERVSFGAADIDDVVSNNVSIMPAGVVNQLSDRQQFLDLLSYVMTIRDGGLDAATRLQPPPGMIALQLPEYEQHVDHAGLIRSLDDESLKRGEAIYNRLCINCHGSRQRPGSLPTALRFAEGKFRSGSDPYSMYRTLTHGFGLMVPQMWMVPRQKYDVIHYIRRNYLQQPSPDQYFEISDEYLAGLPAGDTFGPEPVDYAPWSDMNYGPSMVNTFEIGSDGHNFAYKGIAVRLDPGPGGISQGNTWAVFDHDTMRLAAAWTRPADSSDAGFINWQGIHFDGRHGVHPRIVGEVQFENPTGPGWARPGSLSFEDDQRVLGRDGRRYGPLPREWAQYRGLHAAGDQTVIEYTVGDMRVLESPGTISVTAPQSTATDAPSSSETAEATSDASALSGQSAPESESEPKPGVQPAPLTVLTRTMHLESHDTLQTLALATHPDESVRFDAISPVAAVLRSERASAPALKASRFEDGSHLLISNASQLNMTDRSFTVFARMRTSGNGTIFCKTAKDGLWVPNGTTFFVRGGRLCYDIGWVGVSRSKKRVDDGRWHDVALTWDAKTGKTMFYIDGQKSGGGTLMPKGSVSNAVARIGFTNENFPDPSAFHGDIHQVAFFGDVLSPEQLRELADQIADQRTGGVLAEAVGWWNLTEPVAESNPTVADLSDHRHTAALQGSSRPSAVTLLAGVVSGSKRDESAPVQLMPVDNRLCVQFAAGGGSQNLVVWTARVDSVVEAAALARLAARIEDRIRVEDLTELISRPVSPRWPERITTTPVLGRDNGPFAIDVLSPPVPNPWLARIRLTGHDFFDDGDRVAVCSWDGDVWLVSGLKSLEAADSAPDPRLTWQRVASGLFQPLGLKIVAGDIYVTCRDQLVILRDRNGDSETDFYECFNNDHQVTDHFHEFAMGLQRDDIGNFYYAKSARHALPAVVPHHGTLLRIPSDGSRTEIVATGFRAANGVCLNPDGSFIVTDQEGHWNPKNRINWVREGGFYGNMFGYHDVTDDSDTAMEQPLCWITNAFDRSPAELMWIDNDAWGPLNGTLLNLSYGYGKVYVVPHENVNGRMQGGMCQLPIPQFPTGITRGRISAFDNGLYLSGMFAWGSSQQTLEGGFYRLRPTGKPSYLPTGLQAFGNVLRITFSDPLDRDAATDQQNFQVKVWSLKRTAGYGSKHYDEHELNVAAAELSSDGRTVSLTIPGLAPTWCMEIRCRLKSPDAENLERILHNTVHLLP
ncbi:MAG: DUF6797 domain-containing protein [Fuerstiella sp.]